jgi:hypothetical protein
MQYLGEYDSNIEALNFSPVESSKKADGLDQHGHVWPNYSYRRVRMTDGGVKEVTITRALAVCEE